MLLFLEVQKKNGFALIALDVKNPHLILILLDTNKQALKALSLLLFSPFVQQEQNRLSFSTTPPPPPAPRILPLHFVSALAFFIHPPAAPHQCCSPMEPHRILISPFGPSMPLLGEYK